MDMVTSAPEIAPPVVELRKLWWVGGAFAMLIGALNVEGLWALNFVHVLAGLLWTGIDLFMGFVVGPILRRLEPPARRAFTLALMPHMILLMPTLAIITGTAGWFLAQRAGFLDVAYPQRWWVVAALVIIAILTIQGFGILLPTNLRVCLELRKERPDYQRIGGWMRRYVRAVAFQGCLQVTIIVIMARFVTGL